MRIAICLALCCACGPVTAPPDAGCDAPHADAGPPPPVTVAMRWTYLTAGPYECRTPPVCNTSCGMCIDGQTTHWGCATCAGGAGCLPTTLSQHCCAAATTIEQASLGQLVRDYPACALSQSSPLTYALDCGQEAMPQFGPQLAGTAADGGCGWELPYATH